MTSSESNCRINDLVVVLAGSNWFDTDELPRLEIKVKASTTGQDVASIRYGFQNDKSYYQFHISDDVINSILTQLNDDKSELVWDEINPDHISLLHNLEKIMREMSPLDVNSMANVYPQIFKMDVITSPNYSQWFIDVFLAQVSVYLATTDLIYRGILQHNFPMHFDMPFEQMDGRILTKYAMDYLRCPLRSLKILGSSFVRELEWIIIGFFNGWSDMYVPGQYVDTQRLTYELTHSMAEAVLDEIDTRTTKLEQIMTVAAQQHSQVAEQLGQFRYHMKTALEQINEVFSTISADMSDIRQELAQLQRPVSPELNFCEPAQPDRIRVISMSPPPNPCQR